MSDSKAPTPPVAEEPVPAHLINDLRRIAKNDWNGTNPTIPDQLAKHPCWIAASILSRSARPPAAEPVAEGMELPGFIRRSLERAINDAANPVGMSVHDGKAKVDASHLRALLARYDQAAALLQSRDATIEGLRAELAEAKGLLRRARGYVVGDIHFEVGSEVADAIDAALLQSRDAAIAEKDAEIARLKKK